MVYSSPRTAELFTPTSYGLNKVVDAIPDKSFWGKALQHGVYVASYFACTADKLIQLAAFPALRLAHPVVDFALKPTKRKAALFLPKLLLAGGHILYYETKKTAGLALGLTGLPTVSKMILGRKAADIYFSYRIAQQFCGYGGMQHQRVAFSLFKAYIPKRLRKGSFENKKETNKKDWYPGNTEYSQITYKLDPFSRVVLGMRLEPYVLIGNRLFYPEACSAFLYKQEQSKT